MTIVNPLLGELKAAIDRLTSAVSGLLAGPIP